MKPFNQLAKVDQKNAIDIAVAVTVLVNRLQTGPELDSYICKEFAQTYALPATLAANALRDLGKTLTTEDWTYTVTKEGQLVVTELKPVKKEDHGDSDGETPLK